MIVALLPHFYDTMMLLLVFCCLAVSLVGHVVEGSCGYKPNVRIVGGTEAPPGAWPWQVMIRTKSSFPGHFCGGSLIHPQWVVTAAHCLYGRTENDFFVRLGAHYRDSVMGTEQDIDIEKMIKHWSYGKPKSLSHDIALLKLKRPVRLSKDAGLVCLPRTYSNVLQGTKCWVTGWGKLSAGGADPRVLMQVSVPIVSRRKCQNSYPGQIDDSMICAGYDQGGRDSCQNDSGGPLVCEQFGRFYLEGVVSWGEGCAGRLKYGVYANVRYLKRWIYNNMR
ncbi:CUB and peptidase domain-containing protein 2 [Exaiptasia diaphana]|uniref:Peptidase S1 domain-containing protein n=1 Tax=Exaiptasia diaphana TaxID=2652724 RepID=A0A913WZN6_EXADI|nr:CUB and peptidase domain-containing protein 2 [Exaiptasia diaphana]KXJ30135.1 CUB and peptidase domain-containing protein 1 [Exaiptasia diaphana]